MSTNKSIESIGLELDASHLAAQSHDNGEEITATTSSLTSSSTATQSAYDIYVWPENMRFAGGDDDFTILSILSGAHSLGGGIFGFLNMKDSNKLRVQCVECRKAVRDFPWMDDESQITGSVKVWRAAFPYAQAVNISNRNDIVAADFVHIRGDARVRRMHTVLMPNCCSVTDAALAHLQGIHTLDMSGCRKITDAAFVHLRGIHTLDITGCIFLTDAAFAHLRGIHTLYMLYIYQRMITDAAFVHLRGIHKLDMSYCGSPITDAAFVHLRGIHTLNLSYCRQLLITDAVFVHLRGIHTLNITGCHQPTITGVAFWQLCGIHTLLTFRCSPATVDAANIFRADPYAFRRRIWQF